MAHELCLAEVVALLITFVQSLHVVVFSRFINFAEVVRLLAGVVIRLADNRHRARWPVPPKRVVLI